MRHLPVTLIKNSLGITSGALNTLEGCLMWATRVVMMTVQGLASSLFWSFSMTGVGWLILWVSSSFSYQILSCKLARFLMTSIRSIWTCSCYWEYSQGIAEVKNCQSGQPFCQEAVQGYWRLKSHIPKWHSWPHSHCHPPGHGDCWPVSWASFSIYFFISMAVWSCW